MVFFDCYHAPFLPLVFGVRMLQYNHDVFAQDYLSSLVAIISLLKITTPVDLYSRYCQRYLNKQVFCRRDLEWKSKKILRTSVRESRGNANCVMLPSRRHGRSIQRVKEGCGCRTFHSPGARVSSHAFPALGRIPTIYWGRPPFRSSPHILTCQLTSMVVGDFLPAIAHHFSVRTFSLFPT